MNEQKNNGRGIFYGVIGIATLVVAIVGATFAYFTASADNANTITGNMASVSLSLNVAKVTSGVANDASGLIPMSNGMVEAAVNNRVPCQDDNGNVVCQIYKITLTNPSTAGQFVDGYVALKGGSGEPYDYANSNYDANTGRFKVDASGADLAAPTGDGTGNGTTMRWAQVFVTQVDKVTAATKDKDTNNDGVCQTTAGDNPVTLDVKETDYVEAGCANESISVYSTAGTQNLGLESNASATQASVTFTSIGNLLVGKNDINIRTANSPALLIVGDLDEDGTCDDDEPNCQVIANGDSTSYAGVLTNKTILGNSYPVIGTNYIRVSDHSWAGAAAKESYDRTTDVTSALVFNHNVPASGSVEYYFVAWLTENGYNQTAGQEGLTPAKTSFFQGNVTFVSAQGSEVSATFTDYAKVTPDTMQ